MRACLRAYFKGHVQSLDHSRCTSLHSEQLEMALTAQAAWELTVAIVVSTKPKGWSPELASKHARYWGQGSHMHL